MQGARPKGRRRIVAKAGLGACAAFAALLAASEVRDVFPAVDEGGLAQSLRQSAWTKALSGHATAQDWPWQNVSARMSRLPSAPVRRLGLSASLRDATDTATQAVSLSPAGAAPAKQSDAIARSMEGDVALGDVGSGTVGIGDSITFTASDGATCVYRVTGRPVVDPHLASGEAEGAQGEAGLFECSPLDSLILRATQQARKNVPAPRPADNQRKL
ncbi:hypothetical protein AUC68_07945 [Methyloceanibacter methanicus]|uniref:Uncharacterized protein n=2 Tax=Methyloceanibacter methanicus TaxID=1774968 RepID=A0A1E3VXX7_9HYPH|nr:hypothetical protein AUC68_07945 [Methyloceanibacter methanicus]